MRRVHQGEGRPIPSRDPLARFGRLSRWLHWVTAAGFLLLLGVGLIQETAFARDWERVLKRTHIGAGALLLPLFAGRILWRLRQGWPRHPVDGVPRSPWARRVQILLLLLLAAQLASGLFCAWSMAQPIALPAGMSWPSPFSHANEWLHWKLETLHELIAWTLLATLLLHIAGAIQSRRAVARGARIPPPP